MANGSCTHAAATRQIGAAILDAVTDDVDWAAEAGPAKILRDEPGHLSVRLHGKLTGGFALTRPGERRWILVKVRDAAARPGSDIVAEQPASVRTGRTWQDLAVENCRAAPS